MTYDVNGLPKGCIIQIRNDTPRPATLDPKSPEEAWIHDGVYKVLGPDPKWPGYQRIERVVNSYLLTKAHERLVKNVWDDPRDDNDDPDWYRHLIDPDDDPKPPGVSAPVPVKQAEQ
jgi:hypothetical protein